jgi:hypothetical protein
MDEAMELIDETAAVALEHVTKLQARLRSVGDGADPAIDECIDEAHLLVNDIVSLRNAAELLKRERDEAD